MLEHGGELRNVLRRDLRAAAPHKLRKNQRRDKSGQREKAPQKTICKRLERKALLFGSFFPLKMKNRHFFLRFTLFLNVLNDVLNDSVEFVRFPQKADFFGKLCF